MKLSSTMLQELIRSDKGMLRFEQAGYWIEIRLAESSDETLGDTQEQESFSRTDTTPTIELSSYSELSNMHGPNEEDDELSSTVESDSFPTMDVPIRGPLTPSAEFPLSPGGKKKKGSTDPELSAARLRPQPVDPASLLDSNWVPPWLNRFRLLRATDTLPAFGILFERLSVNLEESKHFTFYFEQPVSLHAAKNLGLECLLSIPIPLSEDPHDPPAHRLIGRCFDGSYMILYRGAEGQVRFAPVEVEKNQFQIALLEGEVLFEENELDELFGRKSSSSEKLRAKETIRSLKAKTNPSLGRVQPPIVMLHPTPPPTSSQALSGEKAVPVDIDLLNHLDEHRTQNPQDVWQESDEPEQISLRHTTGILYQGKSVLLRGGLYYDSKRNEYILEDRRTGDSWVLSIDKGLLLWLQQE